LKRDGFRVVRFANHEVHRSFSVVLDAIIHYLRG
jgi:very-short-patch-repair endonuclease